mgnify:CR=1 FL=1
MQFTDQGTLEGKLAGLQAAYGREMRALHLYTGDKLGGPEGEPSLSGTGAVFEGQPAELQPCRPGSSVRRPFQTEICIAGCGADERWTAAARLYRACW